MASRGSGPSSRKAAPRKASAARRPEQRRRTTGTALPKPPLPGAKRTAVTTRAAILGAVLMVLALALTVPLRQYLAQRGAVARLRAKQEQAQRRVDALEARKRQLQDPAYVEQLARERLHFVRPGEVPYILLTPPPTPVPSRSNVAGGPGVGGTGPWYSRLWGTVDAAGTAPRRTPSPTPTPSR
ncbi:MAG TPA: septum formation initiator family protein [Frankiaceae bacterium]|nr:septum formation initiator family protein [Frankiaceae bacterium]